MIYWVLMKIYILKYKFNFRVGNMAVISTYTGIRAKRSGDIAITFIKPLHSIYGIRKYGSVLRSVIKILFIGKAVPKYMHINSDLLYRSSCD